MTQLRPKILLVNDDQENLKSIILHMKKEGYDVISTGTGEGALELVSKEIPDFIVLEVVLPGLDGVEVCRSLRELPALEETIIVFLTERAEDYSQIAAFEAGADDYIVKPIRPRVLLTRLKAIFNRRNQGQGEVRTIDSDSNLTIDKDKMVVIKEGETIHWQNLEFKMLSTLSAEPGRIFSRKELFEEVWGEKEVVNDRLIDVYIRRIREKIGEEHILTIFGRGYKFVK